MVLTNPSKFVINRNQIYNLTHFICIPLVTASSRPQLTRSLGLLRDSPVSGNVPLRAFVPIDTLKMSVKITMSLPTPDRFAMAEKLLQSLDLNSLTRELSKPSLRERSIKERFADLKKSLSLSPVASMNQPLPLRVTLSGLIASPTGYHDIMAHTFYAQCHDPTFRVNHLCNNLAIIFEAAGLYNPSSSYRIQKSVGFALSGVCLIQTGLIPSSEFVPARRQPGKLQRSKSLKIDSRDLVRTFKEFVWADNIRLERLSICQLGFHKRARQQGLDAQLLEACSVSLS